MKRKSIDELFDNLQITIRKKSKDSPEIVKDKMYTQKEVDKLLKEQEDFLFKEFSKYIESMRNTPEFNVNCWTC